MPLIYFSGARDTRLRWRPLLLAAAVLVLFSLLFSLFLYVAVDLKVLALSKAKHYLPFVFPTAVLAAIQMYFKSRGKFSRTAEVEAKRV